MTNTPTSRSTKRAAEADRRAKLEAIKRQQKAADRRKSLVFFGGAGLLCLALVAAVIVGSIVKSNHDAAAKRISGLVTYDASKFNRNHIKSTQHVVYDQTPPVGGPHDGQWLNCGIYDKPVRSENAVHDLEHGAVWVTYQPDLPKDQVLALQATVRKLSHGFITLSPFPGLPAPVVASAWGEQVKLTGVNDARLEKFINRFQQAGQAPELGSACTGGVGTPLGG